MSKPRITKFEKKGLTGEKIFQIFLECNVPGTPVKEVLEQHGLKPWDLSAIRKRIRESAIEGLSRNGKRGAPRRMVPIEELRKTQKELVEVKNALATLACEFSLLKKRVN